MIDVEHPLLLGSGSPRRREILATLGIPTFVRAASADETRLPGEEPAAYLERVTSLKLEATARAASASGTPSPGALLVADTSVLLGDDVLGKPSDEAEARAMLARLSGRAHEVWTRFAIARPERPAEEAHAETVKTRVTFRELSGEEIALYAATGEGLDKAGAYAVQGIGAFAVARIEGSYANVVGLPACEVVVALRQLGLLAAFPAPRP